MDVGSKNMDLLFRIEPIQSEDTSQQDASLSHDNSFTFSPLGGLIGRSTECDWVLTDPDRRLSGKHAAVSFENHRYQITDLSTNGLFVNNHREPLGKGKTYTIETGDRFSMGPFCIVARVVNKASIVNKANASDIDLTEMLANDEHIQRSVEGASATDDISFVEHEHLISSNGTSLDDLLEFPTPFQERLDEEVSPRQENSSPRVNDPSVNTSRLTPLSPPVRATQNSQVTQTSMPKERTEKMCSNTASRPDSNDEDIALLQFMRGAGLDESLLSHSDLNELMFNFGALLKRYTGELMKLMGERSSYKNQCRLDMTLVAPEHNNPLKYCVNEVQALREIIISPQRENLSGGHAIESAMEDIRDHFSRVEKGYQGTLSSLIDFMSMTGGKVDYCNMSPNKTQPAQRLSNKPWHYRKRLKQLQQKTALLKDPGYYADEFFSPRFAYFYQNPERAGHHLDSTKSEAEKTG